MPATVSRLVLLIFGAVISVRALQNGLIRTPPMGWLDWQRFRCQTDCKNFPTECISENLFMAMADHMVSDGYKDAGYQYVNIDDCWLDKTRDPVTLRLRPDPERFPHGMKALADYIHSKGLKLGIYEDVGTKTCAGYPGSLYYMQLDAQTFADWGIDYLKFDGCNLDPATFNDGYPPMAAYLNMTGRPIALSCEYPLYQRSSVKPDYKAVAAACNVARNNDDIDDSWDSVKGAISYFGNNAGDFASVAGPGFFNDPDMLVIGDFGLSHDQEQVQMALWCIMASPLLMSVDLRTINTESRALLQNRAAIAINQDTLAIQGRRVNKNGDIEIWTKPILPAGSYAFALVNLGNAVPSKVTVVLSSTLMFNNDNGYNVTEVFSGTPMGIYKPASQFSAMVNPNGVFFGKALAL